MRQTVIHVITGLGTGGAEHQLSQLVIHMHGFRHVIVSMTGLGDFGPAMQARGIPVHSLDMPPGRPTLRGLMRLVRLIRAERPAVVQTWLYHADLLGLLAARLARVRNVVWNLRCSDMDFSRYSRLSALVVGLLARLSPFPFAVVHNSMAGRAVHKALGYKPRQWLFIGNGFDLDRFRPDPEARIDIRRQLGVAPDEPLVGLIARYDPMKDHAGFLDAAARVSRVFPRARFLMAGTGVDAENAQLSALIARNGLQDRVFALGRRSDVARLNAALDVAVCSSAFGEGFPNSLGEALCTGLCCVATDVGDSPLVVGESGVVVPPRDPQALADGIARMLALPAATRAELGLRARARFAAQHALPVIAGQYESLYRACMDNGGRKCAG